MGVYENTLRKRNEEDGSNLGMAEPTQLHWRISNKLLITILPYINDFGIRVGTESYQQTSNSYVVFDIGVKRYKSMTENDEGENIFAIEISNDVKGDKAKIESTYQDGCPLKEGFVYDYIGNKWHRFTNGTWGLTGRSKMFNIDFKTVIDKYLESEALERKHLGQE